METTHTIIGFIWSYIGKMENNMETAITGCIGFRVEGLYFECLGLQTDLLALATCKFPTLLGF